MEIVLITIEKNFFIVQMC